MLRDNLAGLIEPMLDSARAHRVAGHPKKGQAGGCSRSTELASVVYKRSWSDFFRQKQRGDHRRRNSLVLGTTNLALDSRAVRTTRQESHRTIDPLCLENPRPAGAESTLTGNASS